VKFIIPLSHKGGVIMIGPVVYLSVLCTIPASNSETENRKSSKLAKILLTIRELVVKFEVKSSRSFGHVIN